MRIIKADERHFSDRGWLKTYWLFSFSDYYDPDNIQFGALRVFNDDIVEPETGFPTHPHREMEIITIVLSGEMTHRDSMGNVAVIKPGDVQRMSAGVGLTHSEFNLGDEPVHFYQIWIFPDQTHLPPSYDQRHFGPAAWKNRLLPVASGQGFQNVVTFYTDATIYRGDLDAGRGVDFDMDGSRRVLVYLTSGALSIGGGQIEAGDQARIDSDAPIRLEAHEPAELVLIDVPSCRGWGYDSETLRGART